MIAERIHNLGRRKDMKVYTKYSNFMENTVGLGRNGKRLAHGAAVGGGVFAAGHYGGVEVIQSNLVAAIGAGVATGFLGTLALDAMMLDSEQEALLLYAKFEDADKEVQARLTAEFFRNLPPETRAALEGAMEAPPATKPAVPRAAKA